MQVALQHARGGGSVGELIQLMQGGSEVIMSRFSSRALHVHCPEFWEGKAAGRMWKELFSLQKRVLPSRHSSSAVRGQQVSTGPDRWPHSVMAWLCCLVSHKPSTKVQIWR